MTHRVAPLLLAAAILAPSAASATVSVEAFYGISRPPSADFHSAVSGAGDDPDLFDNSLQIAGGNVLLHLGLLEIGAIGDFSWKSGSARQTAFGGLLGVGGDMGALRLELLGEVGAQRYGNFLENRRIITASSDEQWFAYVGVRPGIAYRFSPGSPGFLIGLWGFARWDLNSKDMRVTVASADDTALGTLDLGGTTIGVVARVGFDF